MWLVVLVLEAIFRVLPEHWIKSIFRWSRYDGGDAMTHATSLVLGGLRSASGVTRASLSTKRMTESTR